MQFVGELWAAYATGYALLVALAFAIAAIYGQVTVNDIVIARYTADAWRGRVYAVRYFTLFIIAGAAIAMIALLHNRGGFDLVLGVTAMIALVMFLSARPGVADRAASSAASQRRRAAGGIASEQRRDEIDRRSRRCARARFAAMRLRWQQSLDRAQ